ncbi:CPBP family glutamic-type intramembrane protease [Pedobacter nyackensis]|uniref:CAAX protease self-immunity n=1 Tax=Pedobacter nyackensis TaxID=475255 RepID=A0A1W2AJG4_9SPHI|nr:CPBP family glutamic-type intramembrane protease [Pedobacter nyackensis]SMC60662.1 CAAX protease self-immunity [Pedobacter nyackensis]
MTETLSAYWQYLKRPHLIKLVTDRTMLWKDILGLSILNFVFAGMVCLVYWLLLKFNLIIKYEEYDLFQWGLLIAMVLGVIVAPILEEFVFRWHLRKPKLSVWFVLISLALLISSFTSNEYIKFFIFISLLVMGLSVFPVIEKLSREKVVKLFRGYYVFLFYYTAVIFGYIHIINIKGLTVADLSFIIYISSQLFGGLTMGYIRVKYGLVYSMVLHGCFNAVAIPIAWTLI